MSPTNEGPDVEETESPHRAPQPDRYTEPEGHWPPHPRTVLLFCLAIMALAVPWTWWAIQ